MGAVSFRSDACHYSLSNCACNRRPETRANPGVLDGELKLPASRRRLSLVTISLGRFHRHWCFFARSERAGEDMATMAGKVVGVVDNDPGTLSAVERFLTAHGFVVHPYASAEAFLEAVPTNDLVCLVLDVQLDGMSGIELRQKLAASHCTLPVIFMTAFDNDETRQQAKDAGCVAYLLKPFGASALIEAIAMSAGQAT
jgi:CheY-like chemotaxis protein